METPLPIPKTWNSQPIDEALLLRFEEQLALASPPFHQIRKAAFRRLAEVGLPVGRHEAFSYSSPSPIFSLMRKVESFADSKPLSPTPITQKQEEMLLSLLPANDDPIDLLALSFISSCDELSPVARDQERLHYLLQPPPPSQTVELRFYSLHLSRGEKADLSILFPEDAPVSGWSHYHFDLILEEESELSLSALQPPLPLQLSTFSFSIQQGTKSRFYSTSAWEGAKLSRNQIRLTLNGEEAFCSLKSITVTGDKREMHHYLSLYHRQPNCHSEQLFHQVVQDRSSVSVDGSVYVERGADGTDSNQLIRSLLLGSEAMAAGKPRLFIDADDVECRHGATHGPLEEEELFYLVSRGLSPDSARSALIRGFADEVLLSMDNTELRHRSKKRVAASLQSAGEN